MDSFFRMHNQMAQQFFQSAAQDFHDFGAFREAPRPRQVERRAIPQQSFRRNNDPYIRHHRPAEPRTSNFKSHGHTSSRLQSGHTHTGRHSRQLLPARRQSSETRLIIKNKNTDLGTMRREGITPAIRRPTTSPPPERSSSGQTRTTRKVPSPSGRSQPSLSQVSRGMFSTVANALHGGWIERTLTPVRGLFKFCGTDILMENKGGQFYIATFEPSTVSKKTLQGAPLSYDFRMKIKSCSALAINRGKNRFHIVVGYKAPDDLFCITADCNEKEWRLDRFLGNIKTPTKLLRADDQRLRENKFFHVEVQVRGNVLAVMVNGENIFDSVQTVDTGDLMGQVGVMCMRCKTIFKDVDLQIDGSRQSSAETVSLPSMNGNNDAGGNSSNDEHKMLPRSSGYPKTVTQKTATCATEPSNDPLRASILKDLLENVQETKWADLVGLQKAKRTLKEAVILPALRPDLFKGLRQPPRGVLLFGPPGTGKTMLAKCVASESKATFFSISASSVTSKFHGEGEKLVRALFDAARELQPSVIFVDEIDSLLSSRKTNEHDAVRRLKTEFLVQLDGVRSNRDMDKVLIMGATNRPYDLDDAVLRRLEKRIYIPLPGLAEREELIRVHRESQSFELADEEIREIGKRTDGFSCCDLVGLAREAAFGPLRDLGDDDLMTMKASDVRPVNAKDFSEALEHVRSSVSVGTIEHFEKFNLEFGS